MFQQGLSGLNGASKSLDVIGNNIANASTVGFKGSQAQFADLYANSLNGVAGNNAGIGVSVTKIAQQFTQGNIETSSNPLDVSINGGGFFRLTVNGAVQYSRNGQFHEDNTHTLVNAQGAQLTGYLADKNGTILLGAPTALTLDKSDLSPKETTEANFSLNLSSTSTTPKTTPFSATDPTSYNKQSLVDVYDSLGNAHVLSTYYVKTSANNWDVYAASDGTEVVAQAVASAVTTDQATIDARAAYTAAVAASPATDQATIDQLAADYAQAAGAAMYAAAQAANASQEQLDKLALAYDPTSGVGTQSGATPDTINAALAAAVAVPAVKIGSLVFDTSGNLSSAGMANLTPPQSLPFTVTLPIFPSSGSKEPMSLSVNWSGTTQYGSATSEREPSQNGYSAGSLQRYSIDENGVILGQYSNGKSRPLGQIAMANFASVDGLIPLGNNAWAESSASGPPQIGVPNSGSMGALRASSVETSNVDLTEELVNMITAQRVYQANAQTIKTEDSVLQTLVNLR
ncbi:flagellar hook protein FlgE [Oxalobacteraceae bacterium A2-2]